MRFYSTNNKNLRVDLETAVTEGLAPDNGLYMPEVINVLPDSFFQTIGDLSFREMALIVAQNILTDSVPASELEKIVNHTIQFDAPVVGIEKDVYALELFHGPTLAFKDFGARFMSQMLGHFARKKHQQIVILVATSGDTGSAVANGFLGVEGTRVIVLYPSGKVSDIQEKQFTTLGQNVTALEIAGTFDECQKLVKLAFLDRDLKNRFFLTSANSINIARLIPQSFYYFRAYAQVKAADKPVVFSVPSGNFGNLTAGLFAQKMGLPVQQFIASTNVNDVVPEYLTTNQFKPRPSESTLSNAMDVGNPSNFVRMMDLFGNDYDSIKRHVLGYSYSDAQTLKAMRDVFNASKYILDPHGAVGYLGLKEYMKDHQVTGIFLETAHPAKFKEVVEGALDQQLPIPDALKHFLKRPKSTVSLSSDFESFKTFLLETL